MILLVVMNPQKAGPLVRWGLRFARSSGEAVTILAVESALDDVSPRAYDEKLDADNALVKEVLPVMESERGDIEVTLEVMQHPHRIQGILSVTEKKTPSLLILGKHGRAAAGDREAIIARECFEKAHCATMLIRIGDGDEALSRGRIVVPLSLIHI